jgi:hypothetical protein
MVYAGEVGHSNGLQKRLAEDRVGFLYKHALDRAAASGFRKQFCVSVANGGDYCVAQTMFAVLYQDKEFLFMFAFDHPAKMKIDSQGSIGVWPIGRDAKLAHVNFHLVRLTIAIGSTRAGILEPFQTQHIHSSVGVRRDEMTAVGGEQKLSSEIVLLLNQVLFSKQPQINPPRQTEFVTLLARRLIQVRSYGPQENRPISSQCQATSVRAENNGGWHWLGV